MLKIALVVIDGENDFCDPKGTLFVQNADKEVELVANMIRRLKDDKSPIGHRLVQIHATVDTHHRNDIAHPQFWKDQNGNHPNPFTIISVDDVKNQVWRPCVVGFSQKDAVEYVEKLAQRGRNPLCIWPIHCEISTWGSNIHPTLKAAYDVWTDSTRAWISYWNKGEYQFSEHYSAIQADVISDKPGAQGTKLNLNFLNALNGMDKIVWCGWAGSHCLKWTMKDAVDHFGSDKNPFVQKSVVLTDCTAPVVAPDAAVSKMFADWRQTFLDEMSNRGAELTTSVDFLK